MNKIFLIISTILLNISIFANNAVSKISLTGDKKLLFNKIIKQLDEDNDEKSSDISDKNSDSKIITKCSFAENNEVIDIYQFKRDKLYGNVQSKFAELETQYNKINEAYNRYNKATSKPYIFINYNFKEQISDDLKYLNSYRDYLKKIMQKYDNISKNNSSLYVLITKQPICRDYNVSKDEYVTYYKPSNNVANEKNSINIVDQRYQILFSYKLLDFDVFENRNIQTKPVQFIDRDGALKSVNFQSLFDGYMEDLYRIGNDQDVVNSLLLKELSDMDNREKAFPPQAVQNK